MNCIFNQVTKLLEEFGEKAKLQPKNIVVVGCSTSEVMGSSIGTNSSPETAKFIFEAIDEYAKKNDLYIAFQCCEHLNRAIVIEKSAVLGKEYVNVIPQPKAGGSLASYAYNHLDDAVVVEEISADAGIDIGLTLIGMHLKKVAVPLRLDNNKVGDALVTAARTRPKFIGGIRAIYDENML